ncbi:RNA-directed DNA polymerase from transposon X-element, partial [Paramuricea clavata]
TITFLGFLLNSLLMQISLTAHKAQKIKQMCQELLANPRDVTHALGTFTASLPGVMYGQLHYRWLEMDKTDALKINKGNFDKLMTLSPDAKHDLNWRYTSISSAYNPISHGEPQVCITTDASLTGWGCSVDDVNAGGNWTPTEAEHHINYLEMLAVFFALKSVFSQISGKHVKVLIDNTTAVRLVSIKWKIGVTPNIDLFASRLNFHIERYISYQPDPYAMAGKRYISFASSSDANTPSTQARPVTLPFIGAFLSERGISSQASDIIQQSWRTGTKKQYATHLNRWRQYCGARGIDPISASVENGINFLSELYAQGLSYSAINTARSALYTILLVRGGLLLVCKKRKSNKKAVVIEALLFILRQFLAASSEDDKRGRGFLNFADAYGLYSSFFENPVEKADFRDHLLHSDYGLRVFVATVHNTRYVILENDLTDIEWLLKDLEECRVDPLIRFQLTCSNLRSIINSMDTEFDRNALKAVLFATRSRKEIADLGIKEDRAVNFLRKTVTTAAECENALGAAEDLLNIRKKDLFTEKETLLEPAENTKKLEVYEDNNSRKRFEQCKRRLARNLIEKNRVKRRKASRGAPRALDSEDEEFIQKAIEHKISPHGRRHDAVLYVNHRVKKKDFLSIANYNLFRRGKKLIKSATTVLNRGRPKKVSSRAAKLHIGKWLFCAKKPPKTEQEENECTHHQRTHIKNAKCSLFSNDDKGLILSMDDKAYLRPGT